MRCQLLLDSFSHCKTANVECRWTSFTLGRRSQITKADVICPYPKDQPALIHLAALAVILEDVVGSLYFQKAGSLFQLHQKAQTLYEPLKTWAQEVGVGPNVSPKPEVRRDPIELLTMHNGKRLSTEYCVAKWHH